MLIFVDYEHAIGYERDHGPAMLAARTRITYRLEDLAGQHCHLVRYDRIDQALLDAVGATALFISGNSVGPDDYNPESLAAIHTILRDTRLPVFGFCGGLQLMAQALGGEIVPLPAQHYEEGYLPVELAEGATDHPLLAGLEGQPAFRHAHRLHVSTLPAGFVNLASTPATPHQLAVHRERPMVGTQFHPEYWTEKHPAGRTLIANFLRWSGVVDP